MRFQSFGIKKSNNVTSILIGFLGNLFFTYCIIVALVLIFFSSVTIECAVVGESMKPTYNFDIKKGNDIVFVNTKDRDFYFGDIVVVDIENRSDPIIKRVIGIGGDIIDVVVGNGDKYHLEVNGQIIEETYINLEYNENKLKYKDDFTGMRECRDNFDSLQLSHPELFITEGRNAGKVLVPDGCVFVLGDNRHNSQDSTHYGVFSEDQIRGTVERELMAGDSKFAFYWSYVVRGEFFETIANCF